MTISYVEATTIGVDSLRDLVGLESKDLRAQGVPKTDAFDGVKLAHIYWGPTHATRLQRKARDAARTRRHTVKTLKKIENHVKKEKKTPDRLRVKLCDTPAEKIDEVAAKWLPAPEKKPTARHTYRKDGWHKLVLDTNEPWLIDLFNLLPGVNESGPQNFDNLLEGFKALTEGKAKDTVPGRAAHIVTLSMMLKRSSMEPRARRSFAPRTGRCARANSSSRRSCSARGLSRWPRGGTSRWIATGSRRCSIGSRPPWHGGYGRSASTRVARRLP